MNGTENRGVEASYGISLLLPINERLEATVLYSQWGDFYNDNRLVENSHYIYGSNRSVYGNKRFAAELNCLYYKSGRVGLFCGGGMSHYEKYRMVESMGRLNENVMAFTMAPLYMKARINSLLSFSIKGTLSSELNADFYRPEWGGLQFGIEYNL